MELSGIEPLTSCLQSRLAPTKERLVIRRFKVFHELTNFFLYGVQRP
jgi:hypothetical protein